MQAILSLKRHGYLKTIGVFLIAVALIAGVVGCEGEPAPEYDLTMAVNPAGAGTATDQTGTSPYEEGEIVDIEAVAAECYRFVDWTAPAGTFGGANNATTTFTMPARDVTVTANFELTPPDYYKFYEVDSATAPYVGDIVQLVDQFGTFEAMVGDALSFGNPVEREHNGMLSPIVDDLRHYTIYELFYEEAPQSWLVTIDNHPQDNLELMVEGPYYLAVPTQKEDHEAPGCLDHLLLYEIELSGEPAPIATVDLRDQFIEELGVTVREPVLFANPVEKTAPGAAAPTPIEHADEHYVFYPIDGEPFETRIQIQNQFHTDPVALDLFSGELVAVPSQKISWEQPLDHFKTYWVDHMVPPIGEVAQLEDQFSTITANVTYPLLFANPVSKGIPEESWTPIWDPKNHLMFYEIDMLEGEPQMWNVMVDNQFGNGQTLTVGGPIMLAVPTEKDLHGPPDDLDHFLVYEVLGSPGGLHVFVDLWDQFLGEGGPELNMVYQPMLFAVPAQKTHGPVTTPIKNPDDHLLLYRIDGWMGDWMPVVTNQFFGPEAVLVYDDMMEIDLLGVPSVKVEWSLVIP
jgi:hypothetical protein